MAYADYLHCEKCDSKTLYIGDSDLPDPEPVIFDSGCYRKVPDLQRIASDLLEALEENRPDHEHDAQIAVVCLAEEVGELASAWRRWAGKARRTGTFEEMEAELADVLIVAASFAVRTGIDIDKAVSTKLETIYSRGWKA